MREISLLKDSAFLRNLDTENIKTYYVKILILDNSELPIRAIEGRISTGSITINGSSSIRRAGNLTFLAEEKDNDLTDIDNLISMNKKIKILIGIENNIDNNYDKIIWFKQGIFVITNPSVSHTVGGVTINIQFKDKMCLLNGECGGNLPTSVTFDSYDQIIGGSELLVGFPQQPNNYTVYNINGEYYMWDSESGWQEVENPDSLIGSVVTIKQRIYDIIQTLVCNYGGEPISNILINDVVLELKNIARFTGSDTLYYNASTSMYTMDAKVAAENPGNWITYEYNEDCGHIYTDLTYPGSLVSSIGENVASVLDKIKNTLGNYEYFYDIDGKFVFQEIKNYLNTTYDPVQDVDKTYTLALGGEILSSSNYYMDLSNISSSIYTFDEGSALISSYTNTPNYANIKNDFHIWGKAQNANVIHYHVAIKNKPVPQFIKGAAVDLSDTYLDDGGVIYSYSDVGYTTLSENNQYSAWRIIGDKETGKIKLAGVNEVGEWYVATDWRAELYMQGLQKKALQQRPDIYEQELLDLFDDIYNMYDKKFKADIVNNPNELRYWFDYIESAELHDISVDSVGSKVYSYQLDKIKKLYTTDVPNVILINDGSSFLIQAETIKKCESEGQAYSRVAANIYSNISLGASGYSAQDVARDLLYQYTDYSASISITSIPIYYLDVNNRITVQDRASGIYGDYVVKSITLPLDAKNTMSISAVKALERF